MKEIREESQQKNKTENIKGERSNQYTPLENDQQYIQDIPQDKRKSKVDNKSTFSRRIKRGAWVFAIGAVIGMVIYAINNPETSVNTSEQATKALKTHMSTSLGAGTKLLSKDQNYAGGDLTVTHNSKNDEMKIYVWDYAAEDGDYVQVLVDGTPLGDPFMIKNKPVSFTVPAVGKVQVKGIRDGGGGITYGVYYEANHTTYFNGMDVGGENVYTLVRE